MKRIAIFCDGTWNRHDAAHPTNVVQLAQAVKHTADDGVKQEVFYVLGVGAGRGSNAVARFLDRKLGGAMGMGLVENIEDAYRALVFSYEPGDEIFIFGFSRGAYTARSLAGLIRSCGIPPRKHVHRLGEAMARYRSRDKNTHPDDPESFLFRSEFSPFTATSEMEWQWRLKTRPGLCVKLAVNYLGVWDTVGALGVPGHWMSAKLFNKRHEFHDQHLSSMVASARHAVSIDEHRKTFPPALWSEKLDEMNLRALGLESDAALDPQTRDNWAYRQEWFPGDHGSVGGGGDRVGLSSFSCDWVAQGAERVGLEMDQRVLQEVREGQNIREHLVNKSKLNIVTRLMMLTKKDRIGPDRIADISKVARDRIACDKDYQPKTLEKVMQHLQEQITKDDLLPPD
ncbi:DUF2235 domain-containing protein [Loktanella sp. D2R18]|uniref:DUF2235 domain-containing protein n=1 Tax=Rhodobacterales TaxID=204455 RepID=UPI000DEA1EEC|nr:MULTISPECIES: DUF2235 domain-containing protein [Rhodobacterales]MDO6589777.1 DUF2235 domain-containing protein [Yoonia sp. 1_MG-2023]RBW44399.1 DUF2235 domain-containing protein [Loktanella sp. D2R18]